MAPFISSVQARTIKPSYLKDILPENNPAMPVIPQVLSNNADDFLFLANKIFDLGFTEINWNLGCPSPTVVNKKRGSGLLPFPDMIEQFLDHVIPRLQARLSIKLRLGRHHTQETDALWPIFNQYPLTELILHPRLGVQLYAGSVDLDSFASALPRIKHPVVYNGDIKTVADFIKLRQRFPGINSWMIGRGLLANPFLAAAIRSEFDSPTAGIFQQETTRVGKTEASGNFCETKSAPGKDKWANPSLKSDQDMAILHSFHKAMYGQYSEILCGPAHLLAKMKGFWGYFSENFVDPVKVRKKIYKTSSPDQYRETVHRLFRDGGNAH